MHFSHASSVAIHALPCLDFASLRNDVLVQLASGWRVIAFFALPRSLFTEQELHECPADAKHGLCCILAREKNLWAVRCAPLHAFQSFSPEYPQFQRFEREILESYAIEPTGHPWPKPVRFIDPASGAPRPGPAQCDYFQVNGGQIHEVAVGPVHAGIIEPGHFRFQCYGENVLNLEISLGFQHRGLEKLLLDGPHLRDVALTECIAGDTSIGHATAYCVLQERLTNTAPPIRAQLLRRIALECERLANHTGDLGAIAGDTGFLPTSSWNGRIRGDFLNLTATICGNRFGRTLLCPGGVNHSFERHDCETFLPRLEAAWADVSGAVDVMFASPSVLDRLTGTGKVSANLANELGMVGVAARACGLAMDARHQAPIDDLPMHDVNIRTASGGDVLGRATVRRLELADSVTLIRADIESLASMTDADGEWKTDIPAQLPSHSLAVAQVEGWRGELCHVAVTDGAGKFAAYKIYDASWHNWSGLEMALRGEQISDFPLCNKSFNLSYCGHDL